MKKEITKAMAMLINPLAFRREETSDELASANRKLELASNEQDQVRQEKATAKRLRKGWK